MRSRVETISRSFCPSVQWWSASCLVVASCSSEGPPDGMGNLLLPFPSSLSRQEIKRIATVSW